MRFASLGSGSDGNGLLVECSEGTTTTRVLLDCGFSLKETVKRLARLSIDAASLTAIVITHEHADHIGGALSLARRFSIPLHMSWGTALATGAPVAGVQLKLCESDQAFNVGDLNILPFTVPHDAREPLQYVFSDGRVRLGVLTDAGSATAHITNVLSGCDALILECNHDRQMLAQSRYPASLKSRIGGSHGHLSNDTAAKILQSLDRSRLRRLIAAHLSQENNLPSLALGALAAVMGSTPEELYAATQHDGFDWMVI
ncbi:MAG: MBL fold metallo-hydrolase [Janthinobacterium lividum]